jgi:hypothetical protein
MIQMPRRVSASELVQASKTPMIVLNADWYSISAGRNSCHRVRVSAFGQEGHNVVPHRHIGLEWHTGLTGGHTKGG